MKDRILGVIAFVSLIKKPVGRHRDLYFENLQSALEGVEIPIVARCNGGTQAEAKVCYVLGHQG